MHSVGKKAWGHARSNVVAYIALFFALGSGTAMAANTVFSTDIVNGEVKTADIGGGEVNTSDIANDAVTGAKVADDDLGNVDLKAGAVRTSELQNGGVQDQDLADGAVTPAKQGTGIYARLRVPSTDNLFCPAVPNNTVTPIPFEAALYDTADMWGGFSSCAEGSKLYAPRDGVYAISGGLWDVGTTGDRYLGIAVNGTGNVVGTQDVNSGGVLIQNVSTEINLAEGDYVELVLRHTQGADVSHDINDQRNFFAMSFVGPLAAAPPTASSSARAERALRD